MAANDPLPVDHHMPFPVNLPPEMPPGKKFEMSASPHGYPGDVYLCSDIYADDNYEYFHMHIPRSLVKYLHVGTLLPPYDLMNFCGVRVSEGWEHYCHCRSEPHVIPMRRPRPPDSPYQGRYAPMPAAAPAAAPGPAKRAKTIGNGDHAAAAHAQTTRAVLGVTQPVAAAPMPRNTLTNHE